MVEKLNRASLGPRGEMREPRSCLSRYLEFWGTPQRSAPKVLLTAPGREGGVRATCGTAPGRPTPHR